MSRAERHGGGGRAVKKFNFRKAVQLHGRAWLAINDWCAFTLGEAWMESHDAQFNKRHFYPPGVIVAARNKMNAEYMSRHARKARRGKA